MTTTPRRVASYRAALDWIASEDDTDFMDDDDAPMSVTLSMVADLWNRTEEEARRDLRAALLRLERSRGEQSPR